eukprot:scaffold188377_cov21-Tisochrysis_lutea.AAC.1
MVTSAGAYPLRPISPNVADWLFLEIILTSFLGNYWTELFPTSQHITAEKKRTDYTSQFELRALRIGKGCKAAVPACGVVKLKQNVP